MNRVNELMVGDQIFTPARRWENLTDLDHGADGTAWLIRVFTDRTGPEYAWSLPTYRELPTLRAALVGAIPVVRVEYKHRGVVAFVGTNDPVRDPDAYVLAEAAPLGRGQGWEVRERPAGGEVVRTRVPGKPEALSAVKRAARMHPATLGLRMHRAGGGE